MRMPRIIPVSREPGPGVDLMARELLMYVDNPVPAP